MRITLEAAPPQSLKLAQRLAQARTLIDWLDSKIDGLPLSTATRHRLAAGCLDMTHEHQKGIVVLIESRLYGSAFALVRLLFEAYVRGVWLHQCATEAHVKQFEKDAQGSSFAELIRDIEKLDGFDVGVLSNVKKRAWRAMNSYTHSGYSQAARRNTAEYLESNYSEDEIIDAINFADWIGLLTAAEIAHMSNNENLVQEVASRSNSEFSSDTVDS